MGQKIFYICNFIAEEDEDYKVLVEHLGNYPVRVLNKFSDDTLTEIPTIIIGWNLIKQKYPNQNIFDKKISDNLFWTFSKSEMEKSFFSEIEEFFVKSVKSWLPTDFIYCNFIDSKVDLIEYCSGKINADKPVFVYFNKGAMYLRNDDINYIIDIKSLSLTNNSFKRDISILLSMYKFIALSYKNFSEYIDLDVIKTVTTIENVRWVKFGADTSENYFNIIPNFDMSKYTPFLMSKLNSIHLDEEENVYLNRMCEKDIATCWMSTREIAFREDFNNNNLDFKYRNGYKLSKIEYSNKRTITGRITAHDYYNPQNLQKDNDERTDIITRFDDGDILVFDYTSFETRISLFKCGDESYINKYANSDLHYETAVILYERSDVSEEERDFAKIFNHSLIYGAGENTLLLKLSIFEDPDKKMYQIKQFLWPIIKKANEIRSVFKDKEYIVNDWGSIVRTEKEYASFNNLIQSTASEIVVDKVLEIRELLKNKKSQFLFQVHDSLVFDIHPSEKNLINTIGSILSNHKGMHFTLGYKLGKNYKELGKNMTFYN